MTRNDEREMDLAQHSESLTRRYFGRLSAGALAAAGTLSVTGHAAAAERVLTVGASVFPDALTPGISSFQSENLLSQTNEALFIRDNAGNLNPGLALTATQIDDTTMQFKLRAGVKFHDGSDFTAEDVAFTINYIIDPKNAYGLLARISPVNGATVVDPLTVNITTRAIFPTLQKGLSDILIQSKSYFAKVGAAGLAKPMGTGPFVYASWAPGDRYVLTANKAYWGGAPNIDRLIIREIPDPGTRVASLVSGETQVIEEVPVDLIPQVDASGIAKVDEIVSTAGLVLTYDVRVPPFNDPRVRLAFDYAVDKASIRKEILKGRGELLQGQLVTSTTFGFNPAIKARPFDPEKARALLKEANYDFNTPIPIMSQSGKYVSDVDICNAVAGMLGNIGVKASVDVVEGGVFLQRQAAFKSGPIYMVGWYSLGDSDFSDVWFTIASKRSVWKNDEYERLFVEARSTNDKAKREAAYHRMMELMHEDNPAMFLFGLPSLYGASTSIKNFGAAPDKILRASKVEVS